MTKNPEAGKTCERCGKWKDIKQMAAFFPEGVDNSDSTNRVSWCFPCIDEDLRLKGLATTKAPQLYRWDTGEELKPFQLYYQSHKEERQAYQRKRYYELRGITKIPSKRPYTKRSRPTSSSPFVPVGLLEEDRLKKLLLRKMDWMMSCLRDWIQQPSDSGKEQAAIVYRNVVLEVDELRERLSLPPQKLKGVAAEDAALLGELEETNRNEVETNFGDPVESGSIPQPQSFVSSELEP